VLWRDKSGITADCGSRPVDVPSFVCVGDLKGRWQLPAHRRARASTEEEEHSIKQGAAAT